MTEISIEEECFACSKMEDQHYFHTNPTSKELPYLEEGQKLMKICYANLSTSTNTDIEERQIQPPMTVPDKPEKMKAIFEDAISYEPQVETKLRSQKSFTLPEKKTELGRKAAGRPRKKGDLLKNFYPRLQRFIKRLSPLEPNFSICNRNRIKMLELYGDVLQSQLIELSQYDRLATRPKTDKERKEEDQKIWEKDKAKQLLDEYDKLCKKR